MGLYGILAVWTILVISTRRVSSAALPDGDFNPIDVTKTSRLRHELLQRGSQQRLSRPMRGVDSWLARPIRKAITDPKKHWPDGVIPYQFDDGGEFSYQEKLIAEAAMHIWSADTCLTFRPWQKGDKDYVVFTSGEYCWSHIGRKGGPQFLMLNKKWCRDLRTVLHEVGHAIGLYHEQSRLDRDEYIQILWENIDEQERYNFDKAKNSNSHGAPYDYSSVMHYRNNEFSQKAGKSTIKTLRGSYDNTIGRKAELSFYDVRTVSLMYKCHEKCGVYIASLACKEGTEGFVGRDCHCFTKENFDTHIISV